MKATIHTHKQLIWSDAKIDNYLECRRALARVEVTGGQDRREVLEANLHLVFMPTFFFSWRPQFTRHARSGIGVRESLRELVFCMFSVVFMSEKTHAPDVGAVSDNIHTKKKTKLTRVRDCACRRRDSAAASSAGCRRCRSRGASWTVRRAAAGRTLVVANGRDINYYYLLVLVEG